MKSTCAIYARFSTAAQDATDKTSIEDQIRQCSDRAATDGFEVYAVFKKAMSGKLNLV